MVKFLRGLRRHATRSRHSPQRYQPPACTGVCVCVPHGRPRARPPAAPSGTRAPSTHAKSSCRSRAHPSVAHSAKQSPADPGCRTADAVSVSLSLRQRRPQGNRRRSGAGRRGGWASAAAARGEPTWCATWVRSAKRLETSRLPTTSWARRRCTHGVRVCGPAAPAGARRGRRGKPAMASGSRGDECTDRRRAVRRGAISARRRGC